MKTFLFVLVALAHGEGVGVTGMQTITYHSTMAECQTAMNKLLPQVNTDYVKLDCIPLETK